MTNTDVAPSVITREFDAPRDLVFDAWTKVEHLSNWMFPMPGCTCEYVSANIEAGGESLHKVTMPNGHEMWLLTKYVELSAPHRLVFLQYMSNESGDVLTPGHIPNWPQHMLATLEFEALSDAKTKLTFYWQPQDPTAEEIEAFEATRADHQGGWGAGMDQLANYLAALSA